VAGLKPKGLKRAVWSFLSPAARKGLKKNDALARVAKGQLFEEAFGKNLSVYAYTEPFEIEIKNGYVEVGTGVP
jgi:alpha-D-ribose 1-methylphosphonate 5-triphosphate synthase subunit PhnI